MLERLSTLVFRIRIGLTLIALLLFIIFLAQNTNTIRVEFLWWEGDAPSAILILIAALAGFALGYFTAFNVSRRRRKRQETRRSAPEPAPDQTPQEG
jgi:uncharacterized integral membrane protein